MHWLIDLHNEVNRWQKKKIWSYEEVLSKYHQAYFGPNPSLGECSHLSPPETSQLVLTTWHLAMVVTLVLLLAVFAMGGGGSSSD